jgi:bifunctional non-homologous end joining protein LigD
VSTDPPSFAPMRAVRGEPPVGDDAGDWAYEVKWDGMRVIGRVSPSGVALRSANGRDATSRFPELAGLADALAPHSAVLDGEVVSFNDAGRPDFGALQRRMHVASAHEAAVRAATQPVVWVLFDLLWLDGVAAVDLPYEHRRRLLEDLVEPGPNWQVPRRLVGDGPELLAAVRAQGLEGGLAKRRSSPYLPGTRSPAWRKIKWRRRQELVVGGWVPGEGSRAPSFGALLVGHHDDSGSLVYAGRVGSGFDQAELTRLGGELARLATDACPFTPAPPVTAVGRRARWVRPELVVEVAFAEWSADGVLRHPSYLGQRSDKDPADVVRE